LLQVDVQVTDMFGGKPFSRVFVGALLSPFVGRAMGEALFSRMDLTTFETTLLGCMCTA
jgi:hypothetical protein